MVTVGSHSGKLISVEALTGNVRCALSLNSRIEATVCCYDSVGGEASGAVGTYDGTIVCFGLDTGVLMWQCNVGAMIKSKAVYCKGFLYVASYDGNIRCIDSQVTRVYVYTTLNYNKVLCGGFYNFITVCFCECNYSLARSTFNTRKTHICRFFIPVSASYVKVWIKHSSPNVTKEVSLP